MSRKTPWFSSIWYLVFGVAWCLAASEPESTSIRLTHIAPGFTSSHRSSTCSSRCCSHVFHLREREGAQ